MIEPKAGIIRKFFRVLYPDVDRGYLVIFDKVSKRSRCFSHDEFDLAAIAAADLARGRDVYFGVGLQREPVPSFRRGKSKSVCAIPGVWADIDVASEAHAETALPASLEQALELVDTFPLPPILIVHSGNGIQPYWLFNEALVFEVDSEQRGAAELLRAFQRFIQIQAERHDWKIDTTSDLARVYRPPGTINHKLQPRLARVIEFQPDQRYEPDQLRDYLPTDDSFDVYNGIPADPSDFPQANLDWIAAECAWMRHCRDNAARLPEPEWYAALSIIGRCRDADALAHDWSAPHPGYNAEETDQKLAQAVLRSGPRTCRKVRYHLNGERFCSICPHWQRIKSPITLGAPASGALLMPERMVMSVA